MKPKKFSEFIFGDLKHLTLVGQPQTLARNQSLCFSFPYLVSAKARRKSGATALLLRRQKPLGTKPRLKEISYLCSLKNQEQ